jgi:regulator of RNase E activity RraA
VTPPTIPDDVFQRLRTLDTCLVSNAIETFGLRLRNEGFVSGTAHCRFPDFPPMLGYAVTARVRTSTPPIVSGEFHDRSHFWRRVAAAPGPRVLVLQDVDRTPGIGSLVGEMHAEIASALGCVGCVTNGAVRDLPAVKRLGFHLFSGSVSVSHAYAHVIEYGEAVEVGGLKVLPGDLVHGDVHGIQTIPAEIAAEIPGVASRIVERERKLVSFCRSPRFSVEGVASIIGDAS